MESVLVEIEKLVSLTGEGATAFRHVLLGKGPVRLTAAGGDQPLTAYDTSAKHCLLITYLELDTVPEDQTTGNLILSQRSQFYYDNSASLYWELERKAITEGSALGNRKSFRLIANAPQLIVVPPSSRLRLMAACGATSAIHFNARAQAFLAPAHVESKLSPMATMVQLR